MDGISARLTYLWAILISFVFEESSRSAQEPRRLCRGHASCLLRQPPWLATADYLRR